MKNRFIMYYTRINIMHYEYSININNLVNIKN